MRSRQEIENDLDVGDARFEDLALEVLLDIRDLLQPKPPFTLAPGLTWNDLNDVTDAVKNR